MGPDHDEHGSQALVTGVGVDDADLGALRQLLAAVPSGSRITFIVQQLPGDAPPLTAAAVACHTSRRVRDAEPGLFLEPGAVYVNSAGTVVEVDGQRTGDGASAPGHRSEASNADEITRLERELQATREDLYRVTEELHFANEEALSIREELQATGEELEATAEELRSMNDELTRANARLRDQLSKLGHAHDDLNNFFASTSIATLFLDESLRIKRYTPAAAKLLDLGAGDLGRPIDELARPLLGPGLAQDAGAVLEHMTPRVAELQTGDRRWIARQVLPYRTESRRVEGVVVTLVEITELKLATHRLEARERQQAAIARLGMRALQEQDLYRFMDRTVREVRQTLAADRCGILELQPDRSRLLLRAGVGWSDAEPGRTTLTTRSHTLAGFTLLCGEPVIVGDAAAEKRLKLSADGGSRRMTSALCCEIRNGDSVYGVLTTHAASREHFTQEDSNFLQAVAGVLGSAVATHQARQRLAVQGNVAKALAQSATAEEGLTLVLERLATDLGGCIGEYWRSGPGGLHCQLVSVRPPLNRQAVVRDFSSGHLHQGEGLVGQAFAQAGPAWFTDLSDARGFARPEAGRALGLATGFAFPVLCHGEVRGVIALFFQRHVTPDPNAERILEMLGRMIGDFLVRVEMETYSRGIAAIAESSHDAIISFDFNGIVTDWLGGAERLYGYTAGEMIGAPITRLVQEDRRHEIADLIERIRRGAVVDQLETLRLHRDGTAIEVSVRSSPIRGLHGTVVGVSSTDRDIRQQKETQVKLLEADQQKDEFLAMLSHELRNPLAAIHSATDLLKVHCATIPELGRTHAILERQSRHMAKLLDGLLDVSRIVRGQITIDTGVVDLATICRELAEDVAHQVLGRKLTFSADLPDQPCWINGDRVRLAQIIDNLLSNSIRYTPQGGRIDLRLDCDGDDAVLCVTDDGIGIDASLLPHIFGVFRQAQQTLDRTLGGLGIGLPLVKSLVALHGGTIEAHSDGPGRGAEFVVRMPLTDAPAVPADTTSAGVDGRPLDIVLIEDNYDSADALRTLLEMSGHQVSLAGDGEQGIALAAERRPDAVLCDIGLPNGVTGYDVARRLRGDPQTADALLVAITGYGRPEDKRRCLDAGFDNHLTKPIGLDVIEGLLTELTARRSR